ncbi:hypothetical protein EAO77_35700 [Streptomyces sp. t39]|nr:hypothetical protein EAO77_35700 [Streptomyces sp. t39]
MGFVVQQLLPLLVTLITAALLGVVLGCRFWSLRTLILDTSWVVDCAGRALGAGAVGADRHARVNVIGATRT